MTPNSTLLDDIPYNELQRAYKQLEKKNRDLLDGLYYAAFVQQGLMPQGRHFTKLGQPYFMYYNPKQIIGGDFSWIGKKDDWRFYAVGDCTGHGVSGAMLSSLAIGFLNYVVYSKHFNEIGDILSEIDKKWIETFNHTEIESFDNDWLELSMIAYNPVTRLMQYAGARGNSFYIDGNNNAQRLSGDSFPIGGWQIEKNRKFNTQWIPIVEPAKLFLYSDGFKDQAGGPSGKRFGQTHFLNLLHASSTLSCSDQKEVLQNHLKQWQGAHEQTDDICLLRVDF